MAIMDVQVQLSFIIPAAVVAHEIGATPSEMEVPLTVLDLVAPTYHVTVLFAFSPPNPTNDTLVAALSSTLSHFPPLTARRVEHSTTPAHLFFLTSKGGMAVEAVVSSALSDQLQIIRFTCGSIVIASSSHHQATDGS